MSFDRIDPFSAGYGRPGPQRPGSPTNFAGKSPAGNPTNNLSDTGFPVAGAVSKSFAKEWGQNSLIYGANNLTAEAINRASATNPNLGPIVNNPNRVTSKNTSEASRVVENTSKVSTYSDLFHLGTEQTPIKQMNWQRFSGAVKSNVQEFGEWIKPSNIRYFFAHTSGKDYLKKTLVNGNIQPVKDLPHSRSKARLGTGIIRSGVLALMGYDVFKHTRTAYRNAKSQEDGTWRSKLHTYKETSKAFGKYSARDGTSWEAMSVGAALGKALLPMSIFGVSAGGILVGALVGVLAERGMDKLLHTGAHDPNQPPKKKPENDAQNGNDTGGLGNLLKK